ncbi:MAG: hypothetical protein EA350_12885 [Gemmatimonadales bacterium]|nr:MAG: hypothetical protein EA350_12885 [Gemmatimonadales bacterium]
MRELTMRPGRTGGNGSGAGGSRRNSSGSARTLLRGTAALMALTLLPLWMALVHHLFTAAGNQPAPAVIMLPVLFLSLAIWALVSALRDEGMVLILAGGLSFVPIGLFLLFMPGFARWIGFLNLGLVAAGIALLRSEPDPWGAGGEELADASPSG